MFEFGLKINFNDLDDDKFRGFGKELSNLYEIWCYFELIDILNKLTNSHSDFNTFIDKDSWSLSLENINKLDYFNKLTIRDEDRDIDVDVKITLMYNRSFTHSATYNEWELSSYSEQLDPDYTLLIEYEGKKKLLHFDAKYKLDKYGCYKKEDIYKMHTYKDGINDTIGAYILYPSDNKPRIFKETSVSDVLTVRRVIKISVNKYLYKTKKNFLYLKK